MMRLTRAAAGLTAAVLLLSACGGGSTGDDKDDEQPPSEPVRGGIAKIQVFSDPSSLDPGLMFNGGIRHAWIGNAVYGTLFANNFETGEIDFNLAEDFSSSDGGKTYVLKLRKDQTFTDGTPLDAEAVKFNWDRLRDPERAPFSPGEASVIDTITVTDPLTVEVAMTRPIQTFAEAASITNLVWIASPDWLKALEAGEKVQDEPVGAGPFKLDSWARQDVVKVSRNEDYVDPERPYLDGVEFRFNGDGNQRYNSLTSGGADVIADVSWATVAKAEDAGLTVDLPPLNGGSCLVMNTTRAPFDDPRAREVVANAVDLDTLNTAAFQGAAKIPTSVFDESSPYYVETEPVSPDLEAAQAAADELADDGKPLTFTFKASPSQDAKATAESVQAQLGALDNVEVEVETVDINVLGVDLATKKYEMTVGCGGFVAPDPEFWASFNSASEVSNVSGVSDPALDALLDEANAATTLEKQKALFHEVELKVRELDVAIYYSRSAAAAIAGPDVGGVTQYGLGSLKPEELWLK